MLSNLETPVISFYYKRSPLSRVSTIKYWKLGDIWRYHYLILLLVPILFSISIPTAFAQEAPDPEDSPIKIILDQSLDQVDAAGGGTGLDNSADRLYNLGLIEYDDALALLETGDTDGATEHALVAMALFEDALVILGPAEGDEILVLDQLPPDIENQLYANSIFDLVESITDSESDGENLSSLISTNGFDIDLGDYNDALDNAKESLANGDLIGAEEQLDLANEHLDDVYEEVYESVDSEQPERINDFIENTIETLEFIISNAPTLGLTADDIAAIMAVLAILESGDIDKILEATSEDSEFNKSVSELPDEVEEEIKIDEETNIEDAESAIQQAASDAESAIQQAASDAESARQQAESDAVGYVGVDDDFYDDVGVDDYYEDDVGVDANVDLDYEESVAQQEASDAESARQQAASDAESAAQQAASDAESASQQEASDAESASQQEASDAESASQQEASDAESARQQACSDAGNC